MPPSTTKLTASFLCRSCGNHRLFLSVDAVEGQGRFYVATCTNCGHAHIVQPWVKVLLAIDDIQGFSDWSFRESEDPEPSD